MPSIRALYNDELVEAHREAVATLRKLLATEKDPLERRKLANAILRARPAKEDAPPPSPAKRERVAAVLSGAQRTKAGSEEVREASAKPLLPRPGEGASNGLALLPARRGEGAAGFAAADEGSSIPVPHHPDNLDDDLNDDFDDDFDDENLNAPANREIDDLDHEAQHGPDGIAALQKLHAIMKGNMESLTLSAGTPEGS